MTKIFLSIFFGIVIIFSGFQIYKNLTREYRYKEFSKITYNLQGKNLRLLVADNSAKWERGLMYYRSLDGVDGMIFIFPQKQVQYFWNKNTLMNLNLYWINGDKVVGKSFLPSIEKSKDIVTVKSPEPADKVIEIPVK